MQGASLQSYDFTITAGQTMPLLAAGNYFLIKTSTGAIDVRGEFGQAKAMIAGQGLSGRDFTKLELKNTSASTISGLILIEDGAENGNGFFDMNLILSGSIIQRPEPHSGYYSTGAALAANTGENIFTAAQNPNGAIIQYAFAQIFNGAIPAFVGKSTSPSTIFDGVPIAHGNTTTQSTAVAGGSSVNLQAAAYLPAGIGLWFITSYQALVDNQQGRSCRFKLL